MISLQLANIFKSFSTLQVLQNISITVKPGEFVSIIGPTGCGKSTLLKLIAGVENPTNGNILFSGNEVADPDRRGRSGFMPQKPLLLPWRTVLENVILGSDIRGVSRDVSRAKARKLLRVFGLELCTNAFPQTLSGGMSQKVALLRTVFFNNELLLLDEPFGALDALTRISLQMWLLELCRKERSSVLFVTHDIREAIVLSDRILVMSKRPGRIIADITIDLPRPRRAGDLFQKKALKTEQRLFSLLLNENQQRKGKAT